MTKLSCNQGDGLNKSVFFGKTMQVVSQNVSKIPMYFLSKQQLQIKTKFI